MRVCGVELKGSEAVICLLTLEEGAYNVPDCRQRSFMVSASQATESMRDFHFAFGKLMEDYAVDEVVIIQREQKGKHAGTAVSFKLEAAIQLLELPVSLISATDMKTLIKRNPLQADMDELGLKKFQYQAFKAAYAYQNFCIYGLEEDEEDDESENEGEDEFAQD